VEEKGYISLKNFFNIVEAIENTKDLINPELIRVVLWNKYIIYALLNNHQDSLCC
jgi:hypothetical protein